MLSPLMGVSREGTVITFRSAQPVAWTVIHEGRGDEYFTTVERTDTSLTLLAMCAGGGRFDIVARLDTAQCETAPAVPGSSASMCVYTATWRIMWPWQVRGVAKNPMSAQKAWQKAASRCRPPAAPCWRRRPRCLAAGWP